MNPLLRLTISGVTLVSCILMLPFSRADDKKIPSGQMQDPGKIISRPQTPAVKEVPINKKDITPLGPSCTSEPSCTFPYVLSNRPCPPGPGVTNCYYCELNAEMKAAAVCTNGETSYGPGSIWCNTPCSVSCRSPERMLRTLIRDSNNDVQTCIDNCPDPRTLSNLCPSNFGFSASISYFGPNQEYVKKDIYECVFPNVPSRICGQCNTTNPRGSSVLGTPGDIMCYDHFMGER